MSRTNRGARACQVHVARIVGAACILGMMLSLGGCASSPKPTTGAGQAATDPDFASLYSSGQYAAAYDSAIRASQSGTGKTRQTAQLIAGLSAHALNRNSDAERLLRPLLQSADAGMSGKAAAALGLVAAERGKHDDAATLLSKAANELTGDEAARAAMYAGDSYKALKRDDDARRLYAMAQKKVLGDANLRIMIGDRIATGGASASKPGPRPVVGYPGQSSIGRYSVQYGAFSSAATARAQASKLQRYGPVRVDPIVRNGRTLYVVKVGGFASRAEADKVRKTLGGDARVIDR